ncbi:uncharacterized protein F4817DRAFT_319087 [Daldinia loculata]|uniref:uncharacterized protein n=1 Tax=Daldinia loculata TaxID=103429 RepID=UPI0020C2B9D3|nr:uncharacterized protein F4817DRAFT_319087 [Daldinia loculata]KAI1644201.1 hypothetical protein F4817DRAFT_319087 [Daldinia loculata]
MSTTSICDPDGFIPVSNARRSRNKTTPNQQHSDHWQAGDIAFLRPYSEYPKAVYNALINTNYLPRRATNHPVIILEHSEDSKYYLVTTISAYGSGPENDYLPPWRQPQHRDKDRYDFRAFKGSATPDYRRDFLQLEGGYFLPKPKTSWVYTRSAFVVPSSILIKFDKFQGIPRMTQKSLKDLLGHFREASNFQYRWTNPKVIKILQSIPNNLSRNSKPGVSIPSTPFPINSTRISDVASKAISKSTHGAPLWSVIAGNPPSLRAY